MKLLLVKISHPQVIHYSLHPPMCYTHANLNFHESKFLLACQFLPYHRNVPKKFPELGF